MLLLKRKCKPNEELREVTKGIRGGVCTRGVSASQSGAKGIGVEERWEKVAEWQTGTVLGKNNFQLFTN